MAAPGPSPVLSSNPLPVIPLARRSRVPCRTLGDYVAALVDRLAAGEPGSHRRLVDLVGPRRARITLDHETVEVFHENDALVVEAGPNGKPLSGWGSTDRQTVLDLLDGYVEVNEAILDGRIRVEGGVDDVSRMFQAIEILLDASTRIPSLPRLAEDFRRDPCRPAPEPRPGARTVRRRRLTGHRLDEESRDLLARLDLLPNG